MACKHILVVDDEADFAALVKLNLEATGQYEVRTVATAADAAAAAREFRPDLVLLDVFLPDQNGCALASRIATTLQPRNVPIVLISANFPRQDNNAPPQRMAQYRFLAKPVAHARLVACIEACLAEQK